MSYKEVLFILGVFFLFLVKNHVIACHFNYKSRVKVLEVYRYTLNSTNNASMFVVKS